MNNLKFTYNHDFEVYECGNWTLEKAGGFITASHWWVHNDTENIHFWETTKKEAIVLIEKIMLDPKIYENLSQLYKQSLY